MQPITRAIIVLDQTGGTLREDGGEVLGLDLTPGLRATCENCLAAGLEITVAVPGLAAADLVADTAGFVPDGVLVVPIPPITYGAAAMLDVHGGDGTTALVSADRRLRGEAGAAGLVPVAHPALLPMLGRGETPQPVRFAGPKPALERLAAQHGLVALHFQPVGGGGADWALIALGPRAALPAAARAGLTALPLGYDPALADLLWLRIDGPDAEPGAALAGRDILYAEPGQVLIALGPEEAADAFHAHGAHGHAEFLAPDPGLLQPPRPEGGDLELPQLGRLPEILEAVEVDPALRRLILLARPACRSVTAHYASDLDRYSGVSALDAAGPIVSRHSAHPDNKRAEAALISDFRTMGYCPFRHDFIHAGASHSNVIADLPGVGRLRIRPDLLARYREILRAPKLPRPLPTGLDELAADAGLDRLPDAVLRREIERILSLQPWYPWWKPKCPLPGLGAGLVIVGAHMDSTAGSDPGYHPATHPAPGRDDNASGLAGVLALARYFRTLAGCLTHTVRFCLFNAEESGLVGSKAYAAHLKAAGAPIRAVICLDMIGYNSDRSPIFEVHAGHTDPAIRDLSTPLADRIAAAAASYGALAPAQIYRGTGWSGAPDRNLYDGAINRSDHAAFQQQGYGAVLVSEDFFVNLATEPAADPNPHYHRATDQVTDITYARNITCAVARAVIGLAA